MSALEDVQDIRGPRRRVGGWAHDDLDLAVEVIDLLVELDEPTTKPPPDNDAAFHARNIACRPLALRTQARDDGDSPACRVLEPDETEVLRELLAWISHARGDASPDGPGVVRTIHGNLALVVLVAAFDENKNTARDEHP
jgi:hypothetical protein